MSRRGIQANAFLSELAAFCEKFPRAEKILIVPDYQTGHQMLEGLARSGTPWINIHTATVWSLALELAEDAVIAKKLHFLSQSGIYAIIDSAFNALSDDGKLKYFEKHPVNKGIVEALARTIHELRLCGVTSTALSSGSFVSPAKANDIRAILTTYENFLEENDLADRASLITLALERLKKGVEKKERKYLAPSFCRISPAERKLLDGLCGGDLVVLESDPVFSLPRPARSLGKGEPKEKPEVKSDIERLKWLFSSRKAPKVFKDGTLEIFSALGYRNEVREVLRRIAAEELLADEAEIIYTNYEHYAGLIYSLCEKINVPVTLAEGLPCTSTAAGRAVMGFLLWIREDFSELYLRRAIESGGLKWDAMGSESAGSSTLAYLLRTSGVGWGRERYSFILSKRIEEAEGSASKQYEEGDESRAASYKKKAGDLIVLKDLCESLLSFIPVPDKEGTIAFNKLCGGCVELLKKHVKVTGEIDNGFVSKIREQFEILSDVIEAGMNFEEAISKLITIVSGIRIGASGPRPGHLHVSGHKNGGRSCRRNTFMVGLDEGKFPQKITQDPILLDDERAKISGDLERSNERMAGDIYAMAELLAGLRGKLTVSYSSFNIKENRGSFPSSLLLQIFRIKEGAPDADYNALLKALGEPVGFGGGISLDETDWWIGAIAGKGAMKDGSAAVLRCYEGLRDGLTAEEERASEDFTEYDGKITACGEEIDPRLNKGLVVSATQLESAAKCPFAFFVERILGVRPPEETEREAFVWLDHMERGSLLHEVFQKFVDRAKKDGIKNDPQKEKAMMLDILADSVAKYKEKVPPPGESVFQGEYLQLQRDVEVFLQINRDLGTEPVQCEAAFGTEKENTTTVLLGDGASIRLKGKIDRIDKAGPSEYHVWDYKTGSSYAFEENGYVAGGRQVQHGLYSVAAEELLKKSGIDKNAKVTKAGYILPTEKGIKGGKGGVFERPTGGKAIWQNAINKVLDIVGKGNFIVPGKEEGCKFCDYEDICGGKTARDRMKAKLENPDNAELQSWNELKDMD